MDRLNFLNKCNISMRVNVVKKRRKKKKEIYIQFTTFPNMCNITRYFEKLRS